MPRPSSSRQVLDMYWFAHGGVESQCNDHSLARESTPGPTDTEDECSEGSSPSKPASTEESASSAASKQSVDRQDSNERKRLAVEERKRQIMEAEQVKNEAILKKHAEREAALEARRNAQRSTISFAFGTSVPPNVEFDIAPVQLQPVAHAAPAKEPANLMTMSMTSSMCNTRGRRKNDLTPTVPYDRTGAAVKSPKGETRKRSVSMSRLDALAQPRRHYVEAQKAGSTMSNSSASKEVCNSPKRPLSSASEKSNKSGRATSNVPNVTRRPNTATRKPRPVSIAGSVPDSKSLTPRSSTPLRKVAEANKKQETLNSAATSGDIVKSSKRSTPVSQKPATDKPKLTSTPASSSKPLQKPGPKPTPKGSTPKQATPKTSPRKLLTNKKQAAMLVATSKESTAVSETDEPAKAVDILAAPATDEEESQSADEKSASKQHIISEEEAKAALAEKRRLAREQAEREAALLKQQEEEQEKERERQLREEEERQRQLEEEQLRLLEEHRRFEEEKLQKAIEEQERKEEEEKSRREEEARLKAEQEKKSKEEAEKQRQELEEKLRKEEEERAERKKRLEKIMSRTRGKSGTASPSGSLNGSEPLDGCDNQPLSSEPSSLESNEPAEQSSPTGSYDANQALYLASQSLSSNDLMLPSSERTSLDGSLQAFPSEPTSLEPHHELITESHPENISEAQSSETDAASDQDQHSQSVTYSVDQELGSSVDDVEVGGRKQTATCDVVTESQESSVQHAKVSLPDVEVPKEKTQESHHEVLDTSRVSPNQSAAFFQQVESESKLPGEGEFSGGAVVKSESHAMSAESGSIFFEQVESGSVNVSENMMKSVTSDTLHETSGNIQDIPQEKQVTGETECSAGYCGVPGPFEDAGSSAVAKETKSVLKEEAANKSVCDLESNMYADIPTSFQDAGSSAVKKETVSSTTVSMSDNSSDVMDREFSVGSEKPIHANEHGLHEDSTFADHARAISESDIEFSLIDQKARSSETCASNTTQFTDLEQKTENLIAQSSSKFESTSKFECSDISSQFSSQPKESNELSLNLCTETNQKQLSDYTTNLVERVEDQSVEQLSNVNSTIPNAETFTKFSEEVKVEDKEELAAEAAHQPQDTNKNVNQVVDNSRNLMVESMYLADDHGMSGLDELSMVSSTMSFQHNNRDQDFHFEMPDNRVLYVREDSEDLVTTQQQESSSVTEFKLGNVPDHISISQSMTEDAFGSNNPFGSNLSKAYCDSSDVPGAGSTLVDQSSFGADGAGNSNSYISQNVNPFSSTDDMSTSMYGELFMGSVSNTDVFSTTSAQNKSTVLEDSSCLNSVSSDASRTQNPFGAPSFGLEHTLLPPAQGHNSAMDYIVEESEDSSLDSNLSQVNPNDIAGSKEVEAPKDLPNGQSLASKDFHEPAAFCDIPRANGCNGSTYDGRPESVHFGADQLPDSSLHVQNLSDHGDVPSRNLFCLDDHLNSTKVVPNPFVGVTEGNPFSSNPF